MGNPVRVSVVIVSNTGRHGYISQCLNSLLLQSSKTTFEALLVLSGKNDINQDYGMSKSLNVKIIPVDDNNYCSKRNVGAREARGDIVAYIDDDAIADTGWIEAIAQGFKSDWRMAGGCVEPIFEIEVPDNLKGCERLIGGFNHLPEVGYSSETILGCNMFFDRLWLLKTGEFDEYIGEMNSRIPRVFHGGDEIEIMRKVNMDKKGFVQEARVFHFIQEGRINKNYILTRAYGNGRVKKYIDVKYGLKSFTIRDLLNRYVKNILCMNNLKNKRDLEYLKGYFYHES